MSKGVVEGLELIGAAAVTYFSAGLGSGAFALVGSAYSTDQQRRAEIKAKDAYNASLRDRYTMTRSTRAARTLVYGRCRVSGPTFFVSSYGADNQYLVFCVALASHEIDAVEAVYFDDQLVSIDDEGNVTGTRLHESFTITDGSATVTLSKTPYGGSISAAARYGSTSVPLTVASVSGVEVTVSGGTAGKTGQLDIYYQANPDAFAPTNRKSYSQTFTVATGSDTFTLSNYPDATGVKAVYQESSAGARDASPVAVVSVTGASVTISGATPGRRVVCYYETSSGLSLARVRTFRGAPGQTADYALMTELPGVWTSAHTASGVAYLLVECTYDQNAFIGGVPNVSAVIRGRKCFDPRTSTTAWTENPALHARDLATHPLGGRLQASSIDDAAVITAANICDQATTYTLGGVDFVRPLYTASYSYSCDQKPMDGLSDLCQAMGGDRVFADGMLRIVAGAYVTPNPVTMDQTWLTDEDAIEVQCGGPRAGLINAITSSIADQYQDYKVTPLDELAPDAYIGIDGAKLPQDIQYAAISFAGQAQYVSSCALRRMRQGLTFTAKCNLRAWQAERFDVINVTLDRFGCLNKPFEVMSDSWTEGGAIQLVLRETTPIIWDMDAGFTAADIAPNTDFPTPWDLPEVAGLTLTSDDSTLLLQADGTVVPRLSASWTPFTDSRVTIGGYVEVRYWRMGDSADSFLSVKALGTDSQIYLPGVVAGYGYMVIARSGSVVAQSPWCSQVNTSGGGRTLAPSNVTGAAYALGGGRAHITFDACPDVDYLTTEARVGPSFAAGAFIGSNAGTSVDWLHPAISSTPYSVWLAHKNRSGVYSATPASLPVTIDYSVNGSGGASGSVNTGLGPLSVDSIQTPSTIAAYAGVKFNSNGLIATLIGTTTSSYVDTSTHWVSGSTIGSFLIRFDVVSPPPAYAVVAGPLGAQVTLDGSHAQYVSLHVVNNMATATLAYTIYDSSGDFAIVSGLIFLSAESSS